MLVDHISLSSSLTHNRLKNVGNLAQRSKLEWYRFRCSQDCTADSHTALKFCASNMSSTVPDYSKYTDESLEDCKKQVQEHLTSYITALEAQKLRAGLFEALHISAYVFYMVHMSALLGSF